MVSFPYPKDSGRRVRVVARARRNRLPAGLAGVGGRRAFVLGNGW